MLVGCSWRWPSYGGLTWVTIPDAVIGHSFGEGVGGVVAGALTRAGACGHHHWSQLMARLSGQGAMALLELDADAAER